MRRLNALSGGACPPRLTFCARGVFRCDLALPRAGGMRQTLSVKKPVIDLGYRPQSYFWPITHDTHVIAAIKGERRRSAIRNAFDADRVTPLDAFYASPTLPDEDRRALGASAPLVHGRGSHPLPGRR